MTPPTVELPTTPLLGPDPGLAIRCWVAGFLRVGIGLWLLTSGLVGYYGQGGVIRPFPQMTSVPSLEPILAAIPYVSIGLGVAMILGFLLKPTSVLSAFFSLTTPALAVVQILSVGVLGGMAPGRGVGGDPYLTSLMMSMLLPGLIPYALMIWLSPLANHPFSVDSLVFGREDVDGPRISGYRRPRPVEPATAPPSIETPSTGV